MADYIYLLENRLSPAQQRALSTVRTTVRAHDLTLFLTGGAVRDLTGGGAVRDLDITVQGETGVLRKDLEAAGGVLTGEFAPAQALYFVFPGGVRVEVSAAMAVTFPKPGKPKYELTSISEDLRRRDFTANAMALSLNEGSYGLLMDPLNGVADIENRELRLVSNYGFLEDPARLLRAVRLRARLGWQMEARTEQRYANAKEDTSLDVLSKFARGYEAEEIFHEEDPQRVMRALDAEGWLTKLIPHAILGKSNDAALADLRDKQGQLQTQGILADSAPLAFPLLTAKLPASDVAALKASFARQGFVQAIDSLDERMRELQTRINAKDAAAPSAVWRMLYEAEPELVLALHYSGKGGSVQARLKTFLIESPTARQRLPYQLMAEMRITPDNPAYNELLDKIFFELMDGRLGTPEEMKAFLEPYSPPAPPPPLNLRRARTRKEARPSRAKAKKVAATVAAEEEAAGVAEGLMEPGTLTGPDRGDTPTVHEPLEGNVAPLAPGEPEPSAGKPEPRKPAPASAPPSAALSAEVGSPAARKLKAQPAPAPEARALQPHPEATRDIAEAPARGPAAATPLRAAANKPAAKAAKAPVPAKPASQAAPAKATAAKAPVKTAKTASPAKSTKSLPPLKGNVAATGKSKLAAFAGKSSGPVKSAAAKTVPKTAAKVAAKKAVPPAKVSKAAAPAPNKKAPAAPAKKTSNVPAKTAAKVAKKTAAKDARRR